MTFEDSIKVSALMTEDMPAKQWINMDCNDVWCTVWHSWAESELTWEYLHSKL